MYNNTHNYPINSQSIPNQFNSQTIPNQFSSQVTPSQFNSQVIPSQQPTSFQNPNSLNDDRILAGGFAAPFLLGGLTGALISPYFARPYPYYNPYYNQYPYYYRRYPRRW